MSLYLGENKIAGSFKSGASWEVGDIGQSALGIDESLNKRRYLNGQVISQTQFAQFTAWLKQRVSIYPSLAITEADWQTAMTNSDLGQCGQFVIDDVNSTIRLPKVVNLQGLQNLTHLGETVEAGLPNIEGNITRSNSAVIDQVTSTSGALGVERTTSSFFSRTGSDSMPNAITFDASRSNSIYGNSTTVQPESVQYPYFIQVAEGIENSVDVSREIELNNPFSLLDYKFSEYEITNASWLRSNGQFNSGTTYADVYNLLLQIKNGTVTKAGVSVKLSTEAYADTDFVLNTSDTTFRLPLKVALASGKAVAGNGQAMHWNNGVPYGNVNTSDNWVPRTNDISQSTAVYLSTSTPSSNQPIGLTTDPTKSGIETSANGLYLYFYVGAVVQDASVIAAASVLTQIAELLSCDYVIESKVATAEDPTWYRVYKSGWVEQGGNIASGTSTSTISLPKRYANTLYRVVVNPTSTGTNYTNNIVAYPTDESSFTWNSYNNTATTKSWEAKGQGA